MANEERIVEQLKAEFPFLAEGINVQRARRVFVLCPYENFFAVLDYLIHNMRFEALSTLTGFDDGEFMSVMYHIGRSDGTLLNLKISVPKASPKVKTITSYFPSAELYERELMDLLGFEVEGLPEGANRYPLTDDWPKGQHPLRKDWKVEMLAAEGGSTTDSPKGE